MVALNYRIKFKRECKIKIKGLGNKAIGIGNWFIDQILIKSINKSFKQCMSTMLHKFIFQKQITGIYNSLQIGPYAQLIYTFIHGPSNKKEQRYTNSKQRKI